MCIWQTCGNSGRVREEKEFLQRNQQRSCQEKYLNLLSTVSLELLAHVIRRFICTCKVQMLIAFIIALIIIAWIFMIMSYKDMFVPEIKEILLFDDFVELKVT